MRRSIAVTSRLVYAAGVVQLVLGFLFWASIADSLVPVHMVVGMVLVLSLWSLAYVAARAGVSRGLVTLAVLWGLVVPALGFTQTRMLPHAGHWIVQVVHLAIGLTALGLTGVLATKATEALDAAAGQPPPTAHHGATADTDPTP